MLIKGVSRRVVEISEKENGLFEKAVLYVRPGFSVIGENALRKEARKYLRSFYGTAERERYIRNIYFKIITVTLSVLAGILIAAFVFIL